MMTNRREPETFERDLYGPGSSMAMQLPTRAPSGRFSFGAPAPAFAYVSLDVEVPERHLSRRRVGHATLIPKSTPTTKDASYRRELIAKAWRLHSIRDVPLVVLIRSTSSLPIG